MDDPLLRSHGLELVKLQPRHIMSFYQNMSDENLREFGEVYELDPLEALKSTLHDQMVFAVTRNKEVLAITGVNDGLMWSLFSKNMRRNWVRFARASVSLINFYHHFYDEIECHVWTENEMIHQWLAHLGFEPVGISELLNSQKLVHFVRCKTTQDNVHSLLSRPVMH